MIGPSCGPAWRADCEQENYNVRKRLLKVNLPKTTNDKQNTRKSARHELKSELTRCLENFGQNRSAVRVIVS